MQFQALLLALLSLIGLHLAVCDQCYCTSGTRVKFYINELGVTKEAGIVNKEGCFAGRNIVGDKIYWMDIDGYFTFTKNVRPCSCLEPSCATTNIISQDIQDDTSREVSVSTQQKLNFTRRFIVGTEWGAWSRWSECSVTCGRGITYRGRACVEGHTCHGKHSDMRICDAVITCTDSEHWRDWTKWSSCSSTSGLGVKERLRVCSFQNQSCEGPYNQITYCCVTQCPGQGMWAIWEAWTPCSKTCGHDAKRSRKRICTPSLESGSLPALCSGDSYEQETCQYVPCVDPVHWEIWSMWSECACQHCPCLGQMFRMRTCSVSHACQGVGVESQQCLKQCQHKPQNGGWTPWTAWTSCGATCGTGHRAQLRFCTNPEPKFGGDNCTGKSVNFASCAHSKPCPVDGSWSNWQAWFSCTGLCGTQYRIRTCTNPQPSNGGQQCLGNFEERRLCQQKNCPVDGQWGNWNSWTYCSATCGQGTKQRSRPCDSPKPANGGRFCSPTLGYVETDICNEISCHASWNTWLSWERCTTLCGVGMQSRYRICGTGNDKSCVGRSTDQRTCTGHICPVNGSWADWQTWGSCSQTCGIGHRVRNRTCTNPVPKNGGAMCQGNSSDSSECSLTLCPVDGKWTDWLPWSRCSITCGVGIQTRNRVCANPVPDHEGRYCEGNDTQSLSCLLPGCLTATQPAIRDNKPPSSNDTVSDFSCFTCNKDLDQSYCDQIYIRTQCPNPYRINQITNYPDGTKMVDRRCGTYSECNKDWWHGTSDVDKCVLMDVTQTITEDLNCVFCCVDSLCNDQMIPPRKTLYST